MTSLYRWFLAVYVRDVWSRLPELLAAATSVWGSILKIDSTKKVCKKLLGVATRSANWATNVGNERGEVVLSVLTESESMASLKKMADGLIDRYEVRMRRCVINFSLIQIQQRRSHTPNSPLHRQGVLFSARSIQVPGTNMIETSCPLNCVCLTLQELFARWEGLEVRLDIWHFMRRLSRGCCSESHPLYGTFLSQLSLCIFEWDKGDLDLLKSARRAAMVQEGIPNPSQRVVTKALTKEELARHCRRRTRGTQQTIELIEKLLLSLSPATDSLGMPLLKEEMKEIWDEQRRHIKCLQDPPGVMLYTITGHLQKGGVTLPVFRCARGTTSLESFHLHLVRLVTSQFKKKCVQYLTLHMIQVYTRYCCK